MSTQLLEDLVDAPNLKLLSKFRRLVSIYIEKGQYGSGLYWASKAATLSSDAPEDVLRLAECLLLRREFHRAASLLRSSPMEPSNLRYSYLAAKALYEAGSFEEAHQFLSGASEALEKGPEEDKSRLSSLFLLKGYILEALDNRGLAAEAFKAALREDPTCYEAFQALVKHQILSAKEELDLLQSLQAGTGDVEEEELDLLLLTPLYEVALKKYNQPADLILPGSLAPLADNNDVIVNLAERAYYNCDYTLCYKLTSKVIKRDPFHTDCLPIHITCMVELQKPNDLFHLAHKLVDLCPESCISWYAVGCYYYLIKKHEPARRFLSKATQLDRVFGPAWLAYGHSFATENEHDQAIAAYFKACQLMKGCHLPLLYIGVEYSLTNNPNLAKTFFSEALSIAPKDPFVLHEMGVIYFKDHDYITAEMYFLDALRQVEKINDSALSSKWESLLNNLGHCSRKLEKFKEALNFHQQALVLKPLNASTYSAIGHVHALMGNMMEAVESFHKALGLRRDDTFSTSMLNIVIEQLMVTVSPFPDYPGDLPIFDVLSSKKGPRSSDREDLNATKPASLEDFTSNTPISTSAATAVIFSSTTAHNDNSSLSIDIDMMDMSESGILDNSL